MLDKLIPAESVPCLGISLEDIENTRRFFAKLGHRSPATGVSPSHH